MGQRKRMEALVRQSVQEVTVHPLVELVGDRRVLIEHHQGVVAYGPREIWVQVRFGRLRIWGEQLCLHKMSAEQLVICGRIGGVEWLRQGGDCK